MTRFKHKKFIEFMMQNHVVGFFQNRLVLKSGRYSHWYVNWRPVTNDAYLLDQLTNFIVKYLQDNVPDCQTLFGVPEGATKPAVLAQLKWAKLHDWERGSHVVAMGRSQPKEHGDIQDKFFIGMPVGKVVVLEDTTSTASSLIQAVDNLLECGVEVVQALSLTYRSEKRDDGLSVPEYFDKKYKGKIPFVSLSDGLELLPLAIGTRMPHLHLVQAVKKEFAEFGIGQLEL